MIYLLYIVSLIFCLLLIWGIGYLKLPQSTHLLIKEVMSEKASQFGEGKTGHIFNENIKISYKLFDCKNPNGETFVMINGHGQSMLMWPDSLINGLLAQGYQVLTHDNRGVGASDWIVEWRKETPYSLEDMAADSMAVLKALEIKKAHFLGLSMGGMIAQIIALDYPKQVSSLSLLMSAGFYGDPKLVGVSRKFYLQIIGVSLLYGSQLKTIAQKMRYQLSIQNLLRGKNGLDAKLYLQKYFNEIVNRNGFNPKVVAQHTAAIQKSGSRYERLKKIILPVLVIHGTQDPLIHIAHAHKLISLIPDAKKLYIKGMGHDLPEKYIPDILHAILNHIKTSKQA